jgi:hypothetical protein
MLGEDREEKPTPFPMGLNFLEVFMPCGSHQPLLDSAKKIWDAWKPLIASFKTVTKFHCGMPIRLSISA